jgi:hypothetical protein
MQEAVNWSITGPTANRLRHHHARNNDLIAAVVGQADRGCNTGIPMYETKNRARIEN